MKEMKVAGFGKLKNGTEAQLYTLINDMGMSVSVTNYGATLVNLFVPDKDGILTDVVLGYEDASGYEDGDMSLGATVGRCANRIGGAQFRINGVSYQLAKNDNEENNLHSGPDFFHKRIWEIRNKSNQKITFTLHSPDQDQGYPGVLDMEVTYELTESGEVCIDYYSVPNMDTIINMTNHSYFNLNGHKNGTILNHELSIDADYFTRADAQSIPTGELVDVKGTPMDFTKSKTIGRDIENDYEAIKFGLGYDHNWVLNNQGGFEKIAEVTGDISKITMEVYTDLPGVQLYTGNFIESASGKQGAIYKKRAGLCLETQYFPDAVHHDHFVSPICKAGENYRTKTVYKFLQK